MGLPLWTWIIFYVLVLLMLVADLKMFGRKGQHEVNVREALQNPIIILKGKEKFGYRFCISRFFFVILPQK